MYYMALKEKLFVVRKYIKATSITDAIKREKKMLVDDCYIENRDERDGVSAIGFNMTTKYDW